MEALRIMMRDLGLPGVGPAVLKGDNAGALYWLKSPTALQKRKHIDIRYKWINEKIDLSDVVAEHIRTGKNLSDMNTKALTVQPFVSCRDALMGPVYEACPNLSVDYGISDLKI